MTVYDDRLVRELEERRLPSVAAAVVAGGQVVWHGTTGTLDGSDGTAVVTPDTQYRIGSITKTFVAVEILRLHEEGRLRIDQRVREVLDDVDEQSFADVTIAQLLTHTSGLQSETNGPWWERAPGADWAELRDSGLRLVLIPGTRFHYSNPGYALLGRILEVAHGRSWFEVVRDRLLEPLGMTRTTLRPTGDAAAGIAVHPNEDLRHAEPEFDAGAMAPAGQLWASIEDLARWAVFAAGDGEGLVSPSTLELMRVPLAVNDRWQLEWASAQGLGWQVWHDGPRRYVGHGGSMPGFLASLKVEPATGVGVVVLTNTTSGLGSVGDDLLTMAREKLATPASAEVAAPSERVAALAGTWYWGPAPFTIEPTGGEGFILHAPNGGRSSRFVRDGDQDRWIGLDSYYAGEHLVVREDGALDLATFVFTREPYHPGHAYPGDLDPTGWH